MRIEPIFCPSRQAHARLGRLSVAAMALVVAVAFTAISEIAPQQAAAERIDEDPPFMHFALQYFTTVSQRERYYSGVRGGGGIGWNPRFAWRDLSIASGDLNLFGSAFVQFEGFRLSGLGLWTDPFTGEPNFSDPSYYDVTASYTLQIDNSFGHVGIRRNGFGSAVTGATSDITIPDTLDEVFFNLAASTSPLQGGGSVNIYYTLGIHQRISGGQDGTLVHIGFRTVSLNAWVLGDVISLSGRLTFNQRFLQPWGRFSTYLFTAKLTKDISNIDNPGRGPFWLELFVAWKGAILDRYDSEVIFSVGLWVIF